MLHMTSVHKSRDKHSIGGNVLRITALLLILLLSAQLVACGSSSGSSSSGSENSGNGSSTGQAPSGGITPTTGNTSSSGTTPSAGITPTTGNTSSSGTQNGCNNQEATSDCADLSGNPKDYFTTEHGLDHWDNVYPGGEYNAVKEIYFTNTSDSTISWSVAANYVPSADGTTCPGGWASFNPSSGSVPPHTLYADAQSQGYGTHMVLSDAGNNLPLDTQSGCTLIVQLTINNPSSPINLYEFIIYVVKPMVSAFTPDATNGTLTMMGQDLDKVQTVTIKVGGQETTSQAPPAGWPSDTITVTLPPGSGTAEVYFTMSCDNNRYENCMPIDAGPFNYPTPPAPIIITSISPSNGPSTGGTTVTIIGTGFTGATGVSFGQAAASSFTVDSDTQITAVSPTGTGTVDVIVTTPGGTSATSPTDQFAYM